MGQGRCGGWRSRRVPEPVGTSCCCAASRWLGRRLGCRVGLGTGTSTCVFVGRTCTVTKAGTGLAAAFPIKWSIS